MGRKPKYPIYMAPSVEFMERLEKVQDPAYIVTKLEFVQWTAKRFSVQFRIGKVGEKFNAEMSIGGAEPSLEAIEKRVFEALKVDVTL